MQVVKTGTTAVHRKNGQRFYTITDDEMYIIESKGKKETSRYKVGLFRDFRFEDKLTLTLVTRRNENVSLRFGDEISLNAWSSVLKYLIFEKNQISLAHSEFQNVPESVKAGDPFFFYVSTKDSMDRSIEIGGAEWNVVVKSTRSLFEADVVDLEDGSYKIGCMIRQSGTYQIIISTNNQTIIKDLVVTPLEYHDCEIMMPVAIAGVKFHIQVVLTDEFKNVIKQDLIESELPWFETDTGYCTEILPEKAGSYSLSFKIKEKLHPISYEVRPNVFHHFEIKIPEIITSLEKFNVSFIPTDVYGNQTPPQFDVYVSLGGCFYDFSEIMEFSIEFSGIYELQVFIGDTMIHTIDFKCLPDRTESDRRERRKEEEDQEVMNQLTKDIESNLQLWTKGLGFVSLLNEIVSRYFENDVSAYLLIDGCSRDEMNRTYRKCLFKVHPDHYQMQSHEIRLEKTKLFGILQNAHERWQLYRY
jgi:hypothetical protein